MRIRLRRVTDLGSSLIHKLSSTPARNVPRFSARLEASRHVQSTSPSARHGLSRRGRNYLRATVSLFVASPYNDEFGRFSRNRYRSPKRCAVYLRSSRVPVRDDRKCRAKRFPSSNRGGRTLKRNRRKHQFSLRRRTPTGTRRIVETLQCIPNARFSLARVCVRSGRRAPLTRPRISRSRCACTETTAEKPRSHLLPSDELWRKNEILVATKEK